MSRRSAFIHQVLARNYLKIHAKYIGFVIIDKQLEVDAVPGTKTKSQGIRARSRSMVNGVRKLTRLHSFSGSVPRYVVIPGGCGGD